MLNMGQKIHIRQKLIIKFIYYVFLKNKGNKIFCTFKKKYLVYLAPTLPRLFSTCVDQINTGRKF